MSLAPPKAPLPRSGRLDDYVGFAMKASPELRAAFERWRAQVLASSRPRRLPEPMLTYGFFVESVETRVGPQRHRVGLSQMIPWPGRLSLAAEAMSLEATAIGLLFDAKVLAVRQRVADVFWRLWLVQEEHRLRSEHDVILESLARAVRARVETGRASLADLSQLELDISRHHDHKGEHAEARRRLSAALESALGAVSSGAVFTAEGPPRVGLPVEGEQELLALARKHPMIETHGRRAAAREKEAHAERAARLPSLRVGADYIEVGPAVMPNAPDSGRDAFMVSAGISLPLWWGSYDDAEKSRLAAKAGHAADGEAALRSAEGGLRAALADLRDAHRRIQVYKTTWRTQAETSYRAVLGAYQAGRSGIAAVLLAQRDLLELQLGHARAQAQHARAWARLEHVVGRELTARKEDKR